MLIRIPLKYVYSKNWLFGSDVISFNDGSYLVVFSLDEVRLPVRGWREGERIKKEIKVVGGTIRVDRSSKVISIKPSLKKMLILIDEDQYELLKIIASNIGVSVQKFIRGTINNETMKFRAELYEYIRNKYGFNLEDRYIQ